MLCVRVACRLLIEQETHKFHEKRDLNHIIFKNNVILVDFALLPHYDTKEDKRLDLNGQGSDQNTTPDHE